jgi:hypothetical protein
MRRYPPAGRRAAAALALAAAFAAGNWTAGRRTAAALFGTAQAQQPDEAAEALRHLLQSPAARAVGRAPTDYGLGDSHVSRLLPYPPGGPGTRTPFDLWRYAGRGDSSWKAPVLPMPWPQWRAACEAEKPKLMAAVKTSRRRRCPASP